MAQRRTVAEDVACSRWRPVEGSERGCTSAWYSWWSQRARPVAVVRGGALDGKQDDDGWFQGYLRWCGLR
jgi:hypothetical protein